jgi:hypothetical protein
MIPAVGAALAGWVFAVAMGWLLRVRLWRCSFETEGEQDPREFPSETVPRPNL